MLTLFNLGYYIFEKGFHLSKYNLDRGLSMFVKLFFYSLCIVANMPKCFIYAFVN